MRNEKNKWIIQAMILGIVFFSAVLIIKPIGVSTQFSVLSGIIHSTIDPSVITEDGDRDSGYQSTIAYYDKNEGKLAKSIKTPVNYDFIFVLAIPLGADAGYLIKRKKHPVMEIKKEVKEEMTEEYIEEGKKEVKEKVPGKKRVLWKQYLPSFVGGFLLPYGARMADGCTSGHMMSGAVSGYIFAASVFAVAISTAIFAGRRFHIKGGK